MPITSIDEETFVAFTDISGFKEMMKNGDSATRAMGYLYSAGYHALRNEQKINGLFISDCGVLFAREGDRSERLSALLDVVKAINRALLQENVMLTTSIAWGHFSYYERIEFPGIEKNPVYGNGYLSAFMDNELGKPKLQPGECRIVKKTLDVLPQVPQKEYLQESKGHYQYFWNVDSPERIADVQRLYRDSYSLKYAGMLAALRSSNS